MLGWEIGLLFSLPGSITILSVALEPVRNESELLGTLAWYVFLNLFKITGLEFGRGAFKTTSEAVAIIYPIQLMEDLVGNLLFIVRYKPYGSDFFTALFGVSTFELYRDTYLRVHVFKMVNKSKTILAESSFY